MPNLGLYKVTLRVEIVKRNMDGTWRIGQISTFVSDSDMNPKIQSH